MNLHATSTYISTYPLAISLSISQCNNLDFQFEYGIESHHHLSNLLVLTYLPTHQSNKDKLWMIWLNEHQGWTMQWVGSQCSWVRVHPIPINQFTLFPIICFPHKTMSERIRCYIYIYKVYGRNQWWFFISSKIFIKFFWQIFPEN
jgi:hypothetical protein